MNQKYFWLGSTIDSLPPPKQYSSCLPPLHYYFKQRAIPGVWSYGAVVVRNICLWFANETDEYYLRAIWTEPSMQFRSHCFWLGAEGDI